MLNSQGITQFFLDAGDFLINYSLIVFGLLGLLVITIILLNKYVAKFHRALVLIALNTPIFWEFNSNEQSSIDCKLIISNDGIRN